MSDPTASAATPDDSGQADFAAFEAAENAIAIGKEPPAPVAAPAVDPEADDQDAAEAAPAAEAKATPTPTPEKPISKRQQQINDLIRARAESDQRAQRLEAEIAEIKAKSAPKEEKTPEAEKPAIVDPSDPEPDEAKFDTYREYTIAAAKWAIRQAKREEAEAAKEAKAAESKASSEKEFQTRIDTWTERRDAFADKTPGFADKTATYLDGVTAGTPIGDTLMESEVGPQVALYLATHPDEADRIARLAPLSAIRALGKLEAMFDSPMTSASASAGPAARTVTKAPAPPMTLSARLADPADPVDAAIDRGDYSTFEREENRRAIAAASR